ncbi:MAG: SpoIID/LytB domain-containing protein [Bacillota bacterium]|nr:SpoIID/LytB domain-containing protein [Bacillota bacterium]
MTARIKLKVFFLCFFMALSIGMAFATEEATVEGNTQSNEILIKVGLAKELTSVVTRIDEGQYRIRDAATGLPILTITQGDTLQFNKAGTSIQVILNGSNQGSYKGPMLMEAVDKTQLNLFSFRNVRYRDDLRILNDDLLVAVNVLDIDKYLYGVVGPEMGLFAPIEALKAQAVVSRSYALNLLRSTNKWDVGIDTATQVYHGYNAETQVNADKAIKAVNETRRQVIYYDFKSGVNNKPIAAYFHANAGGHTENSENVWLNPVPYIKATPSPYDSYALDYPNQDNKGWPASSYSWTVSYSRSQLLDLIGQWNTNQSQRGALEEMVLVGRLEDIKVNREQRDSTEETLSRRVTRIDYVGSEGTVSLWRERNRTLFGIKSTLYDIRLDSQLAMLNGNGIITTITRGLDLIGIGSRGNVQSANASQEEYYVLGAQGKISTIPKIFQQVTIEGKGHGHGLGMSQWGAMGMANAGYNYQDIIQHYYNQGKNDGILVMMEYIIQ